MGIFDKAKDMANAAVSSAQTAAQSATDNVKQGQNSSILQGIMGNYSEIPLDQANEEYGMYLMNGESFDRCFTLIRDKLLFTNKRILFIDHKGMSGQKAKIESINLDSIFEVELETAGFGLDDSEITFKYIVSPYRKAHSIEYAKHRLEFPKNFDVQPLYCKLQEIAYNNIVKLNQ